MCRVVVSVTSELQLLSEGLTFKENSPLPPS